MGVPTTLAELTDVLARAGFVAATEEAAELLEAAGVDPTGRGPAGGHGGASAGSASACGAALDAMLARRLTGEPLAWITGRTRFCGLDLRVHPGVYVPRWQTEAIAHRAVARLPGEGIAVDLCTGCGAVAAVLGAARPGARVVATDVDARAVACARANAVEAHEGDLFASLPPELRRPGAVDLVVGVVPYVPTPALDLLPRDTLTFESPLAYDGGPSGTTVLRRVVAEAPSVLRPAGALVLELGGDEADALAGDLAAHGFADVATLRDEDGDVRGIEATWAGPGAAKRTGVPG